MAYRNYHHKYREIVRKCFPQFIGHTQMRRFCSRVGTSEVSVIMPVYNAEQWLNECLGSVHAQTYSLPFELSVFSDGSTDNSQGIVEQWLPRLNERGVSVTLSGHEGEPRGVGFAKNRAVRQSTGQYLCFLDADDVMHGRRIQSQLERAKVCPECTIIGSRFHRLPPDSTERYTKWANSLSQKQMYSQAFLSHGPTVIMPTWFCHRRVFDSVGGFHEGGKGTPEDLIFFYQHLKLGGKIDRVDDDLLMYRYHPQATTFSVHEDSIWKLRIDALQERVLSQWESFSIWNAGKQGRKFYRTISDENRRKVVAFCDVDEKKISRGFYTYEESKQRPKPKVPIVHYSHVIKPVIICVKQDMTGGALEEYIESLHLVEGEDYYHFN